MHGSNVVDRLLPNIVVHRLLYNNVVHRLLCSNVADRLLPTGRGVRPRAQSYRRVSSNHFQNSHVYLSLFGKLFETVADEAVKIPSITSLSKLTASALSLPPDASDTASRLFKRSDMYLLY